MSFGEQPREVPKPIEFKDQQDEQIRESLNTIVTDMARDFRTDTSNEGKERYAKLLQQTKERLQRTAKKIDFPKAPGAYDQEVAKQLVWDVVQQDREMKKVPAESQRTFASTLREAASEVANGSMTKEEMQSRLRMEMEKRLGHYIPPTEKDIESALGVLDEAVEEQQIDAALDSLEMKNQKTPEAQENHDA